MKENQEITNQSDALLKSILSTLLKQLTYSANLDNKQELQHKELLSEISKNTTVNMPEEWKQLILSTSDMLEKQINHDEIIKNLIVTVSELGNQLGNVVTALNQLTETNKELIKRVSAVENQFQLQTSRLDTVITAQQQSEALANDIPDIYTKLLK